MANESLPRARASVEAWSQKEGFTNTVAANVDQQLIECCSHYWADERWDNSPNLAASREEAKSIALSLRKALKGLQSISKQLNERLLAELKWLETGSPVSRLRRFATDFEAINRALDQIVAAKASKTSKESALHCCERLWCLRETLVGRPFRRNTNPKIEAGIASTTRFANADCQFVLEVMKAIDNDVTFSRVQTGLAAIVKARRREEKGA